MSPEEIMLDNPCIIYEMSARSTIVQVTISQKKQPDNLCEWYIGNRPLVCED